MYAESTNRPRIFCSPAAFSASCCWQYIVISRCTWMLDSQDSIVWSGRRKTNTLAAHLSGRVYALSTSSMWLGFVLRGSPTSEQDPTRWTNNSAHRVSFISGSQRKNKKTNLILTIQFGIQNTPSFAQPRIPAFLLFFFFFRSLFLLLVPVLHSLPEKQVE